MHKQQTPITVPSVGSLSGQQAKVAKALLAYGYIDKEYALLNLKIRSLPEIVRRLRLKGWPIETNEANPSRLYTLRRSLKQDARLITTGINQAISLQQYELALNGARTLIKRIERGLLDEASFSKGGLKV